MALTDNLTEHWNLADNAASTTVVAQVGSNGTAARNTSLFTTTGPNAAIAAALDFNGSTDQIDNSASSLSFASGAAFSFRCLYKPDVNQVPLIGHNVTNGHYVLQNTATQIIVRGSGNATFTVPSISTSVWHDLVITRSAGNDVRCYLDGTESSTGAVALAQTWAPNRLGNALSAVFHNGLMASASVWSRELSAAEVTQLYNGGDWLAYPWAGVFGAAVLIGVEGVWIGQQYGYGTSGVMVW